MRSHFLRALAAIAAATIVAGCVPSPTAAGAPDASSASAVQRAPSRDVVAPPDSSCALPDASDTCHAIQPWF